MKTLEYPELGIRIDSGPGRDTTADTVIARMTDGAEVSIANSLVHQPRVLSLSTSLGIKATGKADFTVMKADRRAACAGMFTKNRCPSVTVLRNRQVLADGNAQLIAVNSGNANVFT